MPPPFGSSRRLGTPTGPMPTTLMINNINYGMSKEIGKGQMGSALMGSLKISCFFFLQRDFFGTIVNLRLFALNARAYLFPNLSTLITFATALFALTPFVRNQGGRHQ